MSPVDGVLIGSYSPLLVFLSILIAIVASYAALILAERVTAASGVLRLAWLSGGSIVMGIGIWSMHYTAMAAFRLPVPVLYHWPTAVLSMLTGIFASALALALVSRVKLGWPAFLIGSVFQGSGIAGLHYIAMDSMRLPATFRYSKGIVALSVLFAVAGSLLSLRLTFFFRKRPAGRAWRKAASVLLMAAAICIMHYTGMAAATFVASSVAPNPDHTVSITLLGAVGIAVVAVMVLVATVLVSLADRLRERNALLDGLFEQAPQSIALMDSANRVVRVNREFTRMFGYDPGETLGRPLGDLIAPGDLRGEFERGIQRVLGGDRVHAEVVRQRKDGRRLPVLVVSVPISVPDGQIVACAMYVDITERKAAEVALQSLSNRLFEVQETERRHLASKLHDEIGQLLTGLSLLLRLEGDLPPVAYRSRFEQARALVDDLINRVRGLSFDLRPADLDQLGLLPALLSLFERYTAQTGVLVDFKHQGVEQRFPAQVETGAYRVVQEALTNAARHAGVAGVTVRLWADPDKLHLQVTDGGRGFDTDVVLQSPHSYGLLGMRERITMLGGHISVESFPGTGTTIAAELPLD